jgi:hypothetical protein
MLQLLRDIRPYYESHLLVAILSIITEFLFRRTERRLIFSMRGWGECQSIVSALRDIVSILLLLYPSGQELGNYEANPLGVRLEALDKLVRPSAKVH